ncbi:MAG: hypothetical protein ACTS46_00300 [Candidatus Hodgkinia cicadicola]
MRTILIKLLDAHSAWIINIFKFWRKRFGHLRRMFGTLFNRSGVIVNPTARTKVSSFGGEETSSFVSSMRPEDVAPKLPAEAKTENLRTRKLEPHKFEQTELTSSHEVQITKTKSSSNLSEAAEVIKNLTEGITKAAKLISESILSADLSGRDLFSNH